ncbi:bacteriocin immunity protein [Pseudomonas saxonica]|uniref:Bacteriocin immunity protein n=1 Tax=Pseudomonas saxonica TaxID=2600598 RepID=A0A5C5PXD7_9PSED|nr:bacteriocin immunity protein [Pseudomonas saxonica]TWR84081.1 bacteriocin immunity protein [Pseudomonas saxonica]TWR92212.1 bacteriocin immunity protein [Pseudomonas saxonica]WRQ74343.1 bacteriocin immunity protein [Pseudomonas saxonica]
MELKKSLSEYTEAEFKRLVQEISEDIGTEKYQDELIGHFRDLVNGVGGADLIFYPEPGADISAEGIMNTVKARCEAKGLPGFKSRF